MKNEIINLTPENIAKEGIDLKTTWLKQRFKDGLRFKMLKVDGRSWGFIEYLPGENCWRPVDVKGYMFIHCLWVIGRMRGKGYGDLLLNECLEDAKSLNGVAVVTSKKPFLPDGGFFLKRGFEVADTASPYFELLVKRNKKDAPLPKFKPHLKGKNTNCGKGVIFLYTDQCPYLAGYIDGMVKIAEGREIPVKVIKLKSKEEARNAPTPYGVFSVLYNGQFLTHEIMGAAKFKKLLNLRI